MRSPCQERDLFSLAETITLYDLTNTFFEGAAMPRRSAPTARW